ncbi:hypothetical protein GQ43DRAFT_404933 [Delitschia confertaspora ATCC 74209]|uniref:PH domain-containing protein n=1 Tax=Delitschia confertaspora ATCC 74209 TaxID=1513339 RepID=A0A9P4MMW2_9PLEO|nr:hypothetical protein GQ43DRAFT_404933 [Delitschia confertaspora ATCC 74209]
MNVAEPQTLPEGTKFSRYRSVRRAQQHRLIEDPQSEPELMPPMPPLEPQNPVPMNRSMSRYHRRPRTASSAAQKTPLQPNIAEAPPLPTSSRPFANEMMSASTRSVDAQPPSAQLPTRAMSHAQPRIPNASRGCAGTAPSNAKGPREPPQSALGEAKRLMEDEAERQKRLQDKMKAEKRAKLEAAEAGRERLRRDAEAQEAERVRVQRETEAARRLRDEKEPTELRQRLQETESSSRLRKREEGDREAIDERAAQRIANEQTVASPPNPLPRHGPTFGFFRRRKADEPLSSPANPIQNMRPGQISQGQNAADTIRPGGGGAIPGIDAPISAVNAGDRRVMVECNQSHILLPVTPTTTPQDLIRSASICLSESINVKTSVLLESFHKVGLQRGLRNYEHVRDVMNSWDDDKQNALTIVDATSNGMNQDALIASRVPESKPEGMSCYLYYSQKPGKWSKRFVTLRSDGQVVMSKKEDAKEVLNVCHLSDFDIYTPTQRKLAKSVKPPKKICYAVKSQQKSSMFMDESNFVHFFCTSDKNTAAQFYKSIQGWRSWYLKHVMGEGQKKPKASDPTSSNGLASKIGTVRRNDASHARNISEDSHYQLGSFKPLLDMEQFEQDRKEDVRLPSARLDDAPLSTLGTKSMHARNMSVRAKAGPPLSYNMPSTSKESRSHSLTQSNSSQSGEGETFALSGLLGRTYTERQRALQDSEKKSSPFTEGPSLLNNIPHVTAEASGLGRKASVRSNHHRSSSEIQRSQSTRMKPRPLVDLTPEYREPPQHTRKGKGFIPDPSSDKPLVENATSPEEAIKIPPSTDWRSRPTIPAGLTERTRSLRGGPLNRTEGLAAYAANNHTGVPEDDSNAFTGRGLLSKHSGFNPGTDAVGHGVMDGSKARGPMLDVRENSKFVPGSLLARVERA